MKPVCQAGACGERDSFSPRRCILPEGHAGCHRDAEIREAVFADPYMCPAPPPSTAPEEAGVRSGGADVEMAEAAERLARAACGIEVSSRYRGSEAEAEFNAARGAFERLARQARKEARR